MNTARNRRGALLLVNCFKNQIIILLKTLVKSKEIFDACYPSLFCQWVELDELVSQKSKIFHENVETTVIDSLVVTGNKKVLSKWL